MSRNLLDPSGDMEIRGNKKCEFYSFIISRLSFIRNDIFLYLPPIISVDVSNIVQVHFTNRDLLEYQRDTVSRMCGLGCGFLGYQQLLYSYCRREVQSVLPQEEKAFQLRATANYPSQCSGIFQPHKKYKSYLKHLSCSPRRRGRFQPKERYLA